VQINAVRLLIAEHQIAQIRATVGSSNEPVVVADSAGRTLFANDAFFALLRRPSLPGTALEELSTLFSDPVLVGKILGSLAQERRPWRGELALDLQAGKTLPVAVRAEVVPARDGSVLGFFLIFTDLTDTQRAAEARRHLEQSLSEAVAEAPAHDEARTASPTERGDLMGAILANASLAAMDIADGNSTPSVAPLLEELEASTKRATALYAQIRLFGGA
jgi:two-component system, chemotaxis family, sensor kinase Cph1